MILPEDEEYESIFTLDGLTDQETVEPENREPKQESEADLDKKVTATLEDFPVDNWDSNNDAQLIVDWYNERRGKWPEKSLNDFLITCEIGNFDSINDARQLLDYAIMLLNASDEMREWDSNQSDSSTMAHTVSAGGLTIGWLFTIIWCGASLIATVFIGGALIADLGTSEWTPVDGVVIDSGVDVSHSTDSEGGDSTTYCLWVEYEYVFENRSYNGDMVSYSKDNSCSLGDSNADQDYPPGENITVYVNPENPDEAVLLSGWAGVDWFVLIFIVFPIVGLVLFVGMTQSSISAFKNFATKDNSASWGSLTPLVILLLLGNMIPVFLPEFESWDDYDAEPTFVQFGDNFTLEFDNETETPYFSGNLFVICTDLYAVDECGPEFLDSEILNITVSCSADNFSNDQSQFCSHGLFERIFIAFISNESGLMIEYENWGISEEWYWEAYDSGNAYCEWEGFSDATDAGEDSRWWCKVSQDDSEWDTWWYYCELHADNYYCTDMFGQSEEFEHSLNGSHGTTQQVLLSMESCFLEMAPTKQLKTMKTAIETEVVGIITILLNLIVVPILFAMAIKISRQE
ncbi:MAG: hypothetical protein Ct9H90mP16_15440 [Candidatus Poseidoniales archaeon]|nr:MAG: hypothetical protein Ct9H90mP16_15440 [Candidatus Poseidoniales archaeon]